MTNVADGEASCLFQSLEFTDSRSSSVWTSVVCHAALLLAILAVPMIFPEKLRVRFESIPLAPPPTKQVVEVKHLRQPPMKPTPPPPVKLVIETPKLSMPAAERVIAAIKAPEPAKIPEVKLPDAPPVANKTVRLNQSESPEIDAPKMEIRTNVFSTGSSAKPTVNAPPHEVQTGGFGDPNGVRAEGRPDKIANIASLGSFDLPAGAGVGNGTGGARGVRGVVASAGFGNGMAKTGGAGGESGRSVRQGGFADAQTIPAAGLPKKHDAGPPQTPVDIVAKPKPEYTDEARSMKLEGEVLLRVLFTATGEARVTETIHGLGHGLDESAIRAAQRIRFKPALRDGEPVDSSAIVHIVFQLAY
jgi:TonB family protein